MTDLKALAEAAVLQPHLGHHAEKLRDAAIDAFRSAATPDAILALYAERDGAFLTSQQAAQSYSNLMRVKDDIDAQRQAAEAALSAERAEVERLREALERLAELTPSRANARDARDLYLTVKAIAETALTKEPPHAE